jgi:DNA invertase Pin-like site-specific DNA recombinase
MSRHQRPETTTSAAVKKVRCCIYTRVSTTEQVGAEFGSLDAQRDACEAFIASQRAEGWALVPDRYDDGGVSGATLERPALQRMLRDIAAGLIDTIVVYKIDRLCRSLVHFAKLVEVFDAHGVTFASITQSFSNTTSMGKLTLNILLSFAEFERQVIGERVRDKISASKARGMWAGGPVPLGYEVRDRKLAVNEDEAARVRRVFEAFAATGSATRLVPVLRAEGVLTKTGRPFDKGALYRVLNNRTYLGEVTHQGNVYPGEHQAIVPQELWDSVHAILQQSPRVRANQNRRQTPALLRGLIFGPDGRAMSPTHTRRRGKLYTYYVAQSVLKGTADGCMVRRLPAAEIEGAVIDQVRALLRQPEIVVGTWRAARAEAPDLTEEEVREALARLDPLWDELFPAEQARIVRLLVERVQVSPTGADIQLRVEGLTSLAHDLAGIGADARRAA